MRVRPDYHVNAKRFEEIGCALLAFVGQKHVFVSPVYAHRDSFGSGSPCGVYIGFNAVAVDIIHDYALSRIDSVCSVGIVEEAYFDIIDLHDQR